jgi:predicted nucleotide-binding protein
LVLTADDVTIRRGRKSHAPRDNVVFELGLFIGSLGRERTYIVTEKSVDLRLPTDLLGVTYLPYTKKRGKPPAYSLRMVVRQLKTLMKRHGPL